MIPLGSNNPGFSAKSRRRGNFIAAKQLAHASFADGLGLEKTNT